MIPAVVVVSLWLASGVEAQVDCAAEPSAVGRARCAIGNAIGEPVCVPIESGLEAAVDAGLGRAVKLVAAADGRPARRQRRFLKRADRSLARIAKRAARLEGRQRISGDCRLAVETRVASLRALVAAAAAPIPTAPPGLPEFVAGYPSWLRLNAAPIPPQAGGDPHFGTKNVFVNQARAALAPEGTQRFPYPEGAIVVKESTRPGADFGSLVAIMRKRAGSDPAHGDWTFTEYTRRTAAERFEVAARDGVCFGCHGVAAATDWVYTPLE